MYRRRADRDSQVKRATVGTENQRRAGVKRGQLPQGSLARKIQRGVRQPRIDVGRQLPLATVSRQHDADLGVCGQAFRHLGPGRLGPLLDRGARARVNGDHARVAVNAHVRQPLVNPFAVDL